MGKKRKQCPTVRDKHAANSSSKQIAEKAGL